VIRRARIEVDLGLQRRELEEVNRKLRGLIEAIAEGLRAPGLQAKLDELESRKAALEAELAAAPPPAPRLHPNLAEIYRRKVADLQAALAEPGTQTEALEILRGLIERVVCTRPRSASRSSSSARAPTWSTSARRPRQPARGGRLFRKRIDVR
jgi:hypothetical protein